MVLLAISAPFAHAATLWTNANITYVQPSPGAADVLIPGKVSLARAASGPLYNPAAGELGPNGTSSPKDTMWAFGELTNYVSLSNKFVTFATIKGQASFNLSAFLTNKPMVVHLTNEDIYLAVKFTYWIKGLHPGASGFAYVRSTPTPTAIPTVSITNPPAGAIFAAPASVNLAANATVDIGTVTNVEYFAGTTSLGNATVSPYNVTASIFAVGAYALTAVATSQGGAATSAVVNITVANRPTVTLTNPVEGAVFAAPELMIFSAMASVVGGTVTNVTFLRNNITALGSATVPPFTVSRAALPTGAYALSAVAKAAGLSTTSPVVNITWVTQVPTTSSPPAILNGQFSFNYTGNLGLTYVVQSSSNLANWLPVTTNVPTSIPVPFSDSVNSNGSRYYRVKRILNP